MNGVTIIFINKCVWEDDSDITAILELNMVWTYQAKDITKILESNMTSTYQANMYNHLYMLKYFNHDRFFKGLLEQFYNDIKVIGVSSKEDSVGDNKLLELQIR